MPEPASRLTPSREMIERAVAALPSHQRLMQATGGVHAAAWCDAGGEILHVFEDVGRHNGLDKLIGHLAMQRVAMDDGFVLLSSRASYELVRKVARMNIQMLATISARPRWRYVSPSRPVCACSASAARMVMSTIPAPHWTPPPQAQHAEL